MLKRSCFCLVERGKSITNLQKEKLYNKIHESEKILIQKSPDWSYEKEWRIFELLDNTTDKGKTIKIKPLKIIIGACADEALKDTLRRIGKSKELK